MEIQRALNAKSADQHQREIRASEEIRLFTEAFYFFAWRLVEILKSKAFPFDGFGKLRVKGIRDVRNLLIQHPERQNFRSSFSITSNGPVLKPIRTAIRLLPEKKVETEYEGPDRGLFLNAQELHDKIIDILRRTVG
jgi:hypothetical protein